MHTVPPDRKLLLSSCWRRHLPVIVKESGGQCGHSVGRVELEFSAENPLLTPSGDVPFGCENDLLSPSLDLTNRQRHEARHLRRTSLHTGHGTEGVVFWLVRRSVVTVIRGRGLEGDPEAVRQGEAQVVCSTCRATR